MFKNLMIYRLAEGWDFPALVSLPEFTPCTPSQRESVGFVPPRGHEHGPLVEWVGFGYPARQAVLRLLTEQRQVPGEVLRRRTEELVAEVERTAGRKPGKRERAELKERALLELMPRAFARQQATTIWFNLSARLLAVEASNAAQADGALTQLARHLDGLAIQELHSTRSPSQAMADWLVGDPPHDAFTVDRQCELKSADEMKSVVRYARHPLDIEEVRAHIAQGKRPTRLALTWAGRVSFVLTEAGHLKGIEFLEGVFDDHSQADDEFDADAAIATGELSRLLPDLIEALGGGVKA